MARENERKFLLKNDNWRRGVASKDVIYQAYVDWKKVIVKVSPNLLTISGDGFKFSKPINDEDTKDLLEYLDRDEKVLRIRKKNSKLFLTIKIDVGDFGSPVEVEPSITEDEFNHLSKLTYAYLSKVRNNVKVGDHIFEIDEFKEKNEGLIFAEIELDNINDEFEKPEWLGEEVTGQAEYYNEYIARKSW